jgi:hypothetical protein
LAQSTIPKLIKNCQALLPSDFVKVETPAPVQQPVESPRQKPVESPRQTEELAPSATTATTHQVGTRGLTPPLPNGKPGELFHLTAYRPQRRVRPPTLGNKPASPAEQAAPSVETPKGPVITEIKVKCKVPFGHSLVIRGVGGDLDWNKGKALQKIDADTYVCRFENLTGKVEYKILLDDAQWEGGANRTLEAGKTQEIVPSLTLPKVPVVVNFDAPGDAKLFVRGSAKGMSWDKGLELKRSNGKFVLETPESLGNFEFKVLLNDKLWSQGDNFKAKDGETLEISPKF